MNLFKQIRDTGKKFFERISKKRRQRLLQEHVFSDINLFFKKNCPKMASVSGYRKKLTHAVLLADTQLTELMDQIPGPIDLAPDQWEDQPALRSMFVSPEEILTLLKSSKYLARVFTRGDTEEAVALLGAALHEKTVLGVEKNDGIIRRDVPKKVVYFANHELFAPAVNMAACRFQIKHLALVSLCQEILQDTSGLQAWKKELEDQKNLLEFKLNADLPDDTGLETDETIAETKQVLTDIRNKIKSINTQIMVTPDHLGRITRVLENPAAHLMLEKKTFRLDRLGFRLGAGSSEPGYEFSLAAFQFGSAPKMAGIWVRITRDFLKKPA
jgi:hypothetical protein